jgi:predicted nucleotidyltransferase
LVAGRAHSSGARPGETGQSVARLYLFGSVVRQAARSDSDVDLFFDTDNARFDLIELVGVQDRISDILGTESDVMTRASQQIPAELKALAPNIPWRRCVIYVLDQAWPIRQHLAPLCGVEMGPHPPVRHRDPDQGVHFVLRAAVELLKAQMLFDPLEEKFHLPVALVEGANRQSW